MQQDQFLVLKPIVLQLLSESNLEWKNNLSAVTEFQGTLEQCINTINISIQHNNCLLSNLHGDILWEHFDNIARKWVLDKQESSIPKKELEEESSYEKILVVITFDDIPFEVAVENIAAALKTTKGTLHLGMISNVNCAIITKRT